jgi:hypothetical protein
MVAGVDLNQRPLNYERKFGSRSRQRDPTEPNDRNDLLNRVVGPFRSVSVGSLHRLGLARRSPKGSRRRAPIAPVRVINPARCGAGSGEPIAVQRLTASCIAVARRSSALRMSRRYSALPFAGCPFKRNVFGNSPSPQILNDPKSLYSVAGRRARREGHLLSPNSAEVINLSAVAIRLRIANDDPQYRSAELIRRPRAALTSC